MNLSPEAEHIRKRLAAEGIDTLWHFTDIENLPLIQGNGLFSKARLEAENIFEQVKTGGTNESIEADRQRGNWNFISLAYTHSTPMFYHCKQKQHLVYWAVDPEVASLEGVLFTNKNALKRFNGTTRFPGLKGLNEVKFNYFKPNTPLTKAWREYVQAEILVPENIPPNYLKALYTVSPISKLHAELLFKQPYHKIISNPEPFKDNSGQQFSFPFINQIKYVAPDSKICNLSSDNFCWDDSEPFWKVNRTIHLGFEVHATVGAHLWVYLDRDLLITYTFPSTGMQTVGRMLQLSGRQGTLRVFINQICWLKCEVR